MASPRCCAGGKAGDRNGCGNQPRGAMRDIAVYALACLGLVGGFLESEDTMCEISVCGSWVGDSAILVGMVDGSSPWEAGLMVHRHGRLG